MTDEILTTEVGPWGILTLNRPKALNSLTAAMCVSIDAALEQWAGPAVGAVLIEGEGDRAFCAGGDIRWLATTAASDPVEAATFFRTEYRMNVRIHQFAKPYVALMDGVTMGGGVGVSLSASHRVATDRTLWAMPECMIGLVPDVGGSWLLPRLPTGVGYFLGLTGRRLNGADMCAVGLATHYVPAEAIPALRADLLSMEADAVTADGVDAVIATHQTTAESDLVAHLPEIASLFGDVAPVPEIIERLTAAGTPLAEEALNAIRPASPTSLRLTHRLLSAAPSRFEDCIAREFRVAAHLMAGHDFREGVRAQIIDKDRDPKWQPRSLAEVRDAEIDAYFAEPTGGDLVY